MFGHWDKRLAAAMGPGVYKCYKRPYKPWSVSREEFRRAQVAAVPRPKVTAAAAVVPKLPPPTASAVTSDGGEERTRGNLLGGWLKPWGRTASAIVVQNHGFHVQAHVNHDYKFYLT